MIEQSTDSLFHIFLFIIIIHIKHRLLCLVTHVKDSQHSLPASHVKDSQHGLPALHVKDSQHGLPASHVEDSQHGHVLKD